jgi:hypothetical protein
MVEITTTRTRLWKMLKAMEIPQSITAAEVAALDQMPLAEISEKRALAQERVELMADERR